MYDVITFGSATNDTFLKLKDEAVHDGLCLPLGSKMMVDGLDIFTGGGGTNTACSFASLGFKTAYVGKIGDDSAGKKVADELKKFKVSTSFLKKDKERRTAISAVLSSTKGERTILIYSGACHFLEQSDIPWKKLKKTKWFYIAPLSRKSVNMFSRIVDFAKANGIKIAVNPGSSQLNLSRDILDPILAKVDVLILNKEELGLLCPDKSDVFEMIKIISRICRAVIVVTLGKQGSVAYNGENFFQAGIVDQGLVEKTGAGDAYGAGFLAGLLLENNIEYAMRLGTANAAACVVQVGAKNGLLTKQDLVDLPDLPVSKKEF